MATPPSEALPPDPPDPPDPPEPPVAPPAPPALEPTLPPLPLALPLDPPDPLAVEDVELTALVDPAAPPVFEVEAGRPPGASSVAEHAATRHAAAQKLRVRSRKLYIINAFERDTPRRKWPTGRQSVHPTTEHSRVPHSCVHGAAVRIGPNPMCGRDQNEVCWPYIGQNRVIAPTCRSHPTRHGEEQSRALSQAR